jgi:hypothetical protein
MVRIATSAVIAAAVFALTIAVRPIDAMDAQEQAGVRVPRSVLERYVGEWVYPDGNSFKVGLEGDTLFQEIPGRRLAYAPISETLFMLGPSFTAEFVIDQAGGATQILSNGFSVEFRLRRKGSPPAKPVASSAPAAAAGRVPKSVLERYVGVYEFIPGQMKRTDLRIVVRLEGDTLIRDGVGSKRAVLMPISETRFKVASTSFVVEFVVDEAGVTQVLGTGFQQMLARLTSKRSARH